MKTQLRLASQRLGQLQAKLDSQGNVSRKDIATLLQQGDVALARAKAQKIIQDDILGDLLETLEMEIGVILEHFSELEHSSLAPSPTIVEAASSIIYAAPYVRSKDLDMVRSILIQHFGPDFARSATGNRDNHVSSRIVRATSATLPSASLLNQYLKSVAQNYGVKWTPEPLREEIVDSLSEMLDPEVMPVVDLPRLRKLCLHGIPDEPSWLRPRIWKLFLGYLPETTATWKSEASKQRQCYYDLARRLLKPYEAAASPTSPLSSSDEILLSVQKQLSGVPRNIFASLEDGPEIYPQCPLSTIYEGEDKVSCARALDARLKLLQENGSQAVAPEIRLEEPSADATPEISLTSFDSALTGLNNPMTLLPSKAYSFGDAHPLHCSALLRLLYLHTSINPANRSSHIPSLLIPVYSALNQEIEPEELSHVEADTFWVFEAIVAEFSELEEEGGTKWMRRFSERLLYADAELFEDLQAKGLDPALPHYSFRWITPLLTHTLPLPSALVAWDALLSWQQRARDMNPKSDFLLDICTAMLIHSRAALLRISNVGPKAASLWADESSDVHPSPSMSDPFLEGLRTLQKYPIEAFGGIERILQTAVDLAQKRAQEANAAKHESLSLGARLKVTMWKGFTNQASSPEDSPSEDEDSSEDEHVDGNETETQENSTYTQFASTMWKGITNRPVESPLPSNPPPAPPASIPRQTEQLRTNGADQFQASTPTPAASSIWGYAEKLKESNAAATLAKVSSNWRARALMGTWGRGADQSRTSDLREHHTAHSESASPIIRPHSDDRRGSLPVERIGIYSPPTRSLNFRSDDPFKPPQVGSALFSPTNSEGAAQNSGILDKTRSLLLTRSPPQTASKSGPRPLLLNSATLITAGKKDSPPFPISGVMSTPDTEEWADVMRLKQRHVHRDSQSSISSLSPSDALGRPLNSAKFDWDSDGSGSRVVPLNRRSISPMAPNFRVLHSRSSSRNSSAPSPDSSRLSGLARNVHSPAIADSWVSPPASAPSVYEIKTRSAMDQANGASSEASDSTPHEPPSPVRKLSRKKTDPSITTDDTSDSPAVRLPTRTARVRSKRHPARPTNLQIQDNPAKSRTSIEQKTPSPSAANLSVPWPGDEIDAVATPRASKFELEDDAAPFNLGRSPRRSRKVSSGSPEKRNVSSDRQDSRTRKVSAGHRVRKVSVENRDPPGSSRDSAAEEGDDEGYDELLSAYESEDGPDMSSLR